MRQYFIRRVLLLFPTIIGVTIVVSGISSLLPGDAVDILAEEYRGSREEIDDAKARIRHRLGLDQIWPERYWHWITDAIQGDFGISLHGANRSVIDDLKPRIPVTFELGILAMLAGTLIAIPVGVYSAIRQDTRGDYFTRGLAIALVAIPSFWLATLIISIMIPKLGLPALPIRWTGLFDDPIANFKQVWVPSLILGTALAGSLMRLTRTTMLEVLRQDYVRTAWAKGLRERTVIFRHALRNAMIPIVTVIGLQLPIVIGGSVIIEQIFVLPGMGRRLIRALNERDTPVVLAINVLIALAVVITNLAVDMTYSLLDPRIRYD